MGGKIVCGEVHCVWPVNVLNQYGFPVFDEMCCSHIPNVCPFPTELRSGEGGWPMLDTSCLLREFGSSADKSSPSLFMLPPRGDTVTGILKRGAGPDQNLGRTRRPAVARSDSDFDSWSTRSGRVGLRPSSTWGSAAGRQARCGQCPRPGPHCPAGGLSRAVSGLTTPRQPGLKSLCLNRQNRALKPKLSMIFKSVGEIMMAKENTD